MLRELAGKRVYAVTLVMAVVCNITCVQAEGVETWERDDLSGMIVARAAELDARIQQRMQDRLRRQLKRDLIIEVYMEDRDDLAELPCGIDFERPVAVLGE